MAEDAIGATTPGREDTVRETRRREAPKARVPKFDGTGRWESFKCQFQSMAKLCHWDEEEVLVQLTSALSGEAAEFVYSSLDAEERECAESVMTALESNFQPALSEDAHIHALEQRTMRSGEDVARYVASLRRLSIKAYPNSGSQEKERHAI